MLLPTVLMFLIYVFLYWGNMEELGHCALGEYKFGYWFTFALFLMNLLHWGISSIIRRFHSTNDVCTLLILGIVAFGLIVLKNWDWEHNEATLARWFSLRLIAMYFPFYLIGMTCKHWQMSFHRFIDNNHVVASLMILFAVGLHQSSGGFWLGMVMGWLGVMLLYRLCFFYRQQLSETTFIGRQLSMIGRNTLQIYLIHYFFFLGLKLPALGAILDSEELWIVKFVVASLLTVAIVYGCMATTKLVQISSTLSKIVLGKL